MNALHVKKGDIVRVLAGDDRGKTGKVLQVLPEKQRVVVEGVAIVKKHLRKSQDNPKGGIASKEGTLHVSNVMRLDKWEARQKKRGKAVA
jgi:large subunit ribosomal protein L24